jgi:hypothetical protein
MCKTTGPGLQDDLNSVLSRSFRAVIRLARLSCGAQGSIASQSLFWRSLSSLGFPHVLAAQLGEVAKAPADIEVRTSPNSFLQHMAGEISTPSPLCGAKRPNRFTPATGTTILRET